MTAFTHRPPPALARSCVPMLAMALAAALMSGCAVGPEYRQPSNELTPTFAGAALLAQREGDAPAPALDQWWTGFRDPVLTRVVQRVLDQNLDLAASMARVDQARAAAVGAGALRLPQGDLTASHLSQRQSLKSPDGRLASPFPGYERDQHVDALGVGATWEADLAGGLKSGEAAAVAEWQAAEAARTGVRVSVAAEAADAYFRVRGAQRRIAVAEEQIRTEDRLVGLVQDRLGHGLATNREAAQAQALALQARSTVPPMRVELASQLNRLDVLMGMQAGTFAATQVGDTQDYEVPTIGAELTPTDLLRRRPDVIDAERRLAASNARIGVAVAEYYPKLSLGAILGFDSMQGGLLSSQAFQPQALLGLRWRLFDFGRVDAEVAQAKGAHAEALVHYRQAMLRATEELEDSIVTLTQLERQRQDLAQEIAAHRTASDAAKDAYGGGAVSLIEVLDEDRQLLVARDLMAQVDANDARAAVATFRALGGGWEAPPVVSGAARIEPAGRVSEAGSAVARSPDL